MPEEPILEKYLSGLPKDEAIEAAYLAIRLFRYRQWLRSLKSDPHEAMNHLITKDRGDRAPNVAGHAALSIVNQICRIEDSRFEEINDKAAADYVKLLSEFVARQVSESKSDRVRGRTLLADLRRASDSLLRGL